MIVLDSATAPSPQQATAARDAGIGMWCVYVATRPGVHLYHPWTAAEIEVARIVHPKPIAFYSGADDPASVRALCKSANLTPCLDVEDGIQKDGPWVQGNLDAVGGGLYGGKNVHPGRRALFHIGSYYPSQQPAGQPTWPSWWPQPSAPHGWQIFNTHTEFGVGVDRSYFEDSLAALLGVTKGEDVTGSEKLAWIIIAKAVAGHVVNQADYDAYFPIFKDDGSNVQEVVWKIFQEQGGPDWIAKAGQPGPPGPPNTAIPVHSHPITANTGDPYK